MLTHQQLRSPRFSRADRLVDSMMVIMATSHITMLECYDVTARRHRYVMTDADHLGKHAVCPRQPVGCSESDRWINCEITGFEKPAFKQFGPAARLRSTTAFSAGLSPRSAANRAARPSSE